MRQHSKFAARVHGSFARGAAREAGFASRRVGPGAAQRAAAEAMAEPTEGGAVFGRDGLFSMACVTIFRRLAARRGLRSPADAGPSRG